MTCTIYAIRHGFKIHEDAVSIEADIGEDVNAIDAEKTRSSLENYLFSEYSVPLHSIRCSPRIRSTQTAGLIRSMSTADIVTDISFCDLIEQNNPQYQDNPLVRISASNYRSIFDRGIHAWAKQQEKEGVGEWQRIQDFFFSDPQLKTKSPIDSDAFGNSMSAYEIGKRAYVSLSQFTENTIETGILVSHSLVLEPMIAYSLMQMRQNMQDDRESFYETLHHFITHSVGEKQWDYTEPSKLSLIEGKLSKIEFRGDTYDVDS
ncbi:hypothetical protein ACFL0V_05485 [Nanoarchaeota archaeon]